MREIHIETQRLVLRRETPEDYLDAFTWSGDERVYRYLLASPCKKPEDMIPWLESLDQDSEESYVMIAHHRETNKPIGTFGMFYDNEEDTWSLAYNIRYDEWGKGYATEGSRAMMEYVRKTHGAHNFEGECAAENIGSARVLEHLGMVYDHDASYSKHDGSATYPSKVYRLRD